MQQQDRSAFADIIQCDHGILDLNFDRCQSSRRSVWIRTPTQRIVAIPRRPAGVAAAGHVTGTPISTPLSDLNRRDVADGTNEARGLADPLFGSRGLQ